MLFLVAASAFVFYGLFLMCFGSQTFNIFNNISQHIKLKFTNKNYTITFNQHNDLETTSLHQPPAQPHLSPPPNFILIPKNLQNNGNNKIIRNKDIKWIIMASKNIDANNKSIKFHIIKSSTLEWYPYDLF